MVRKKWGGRICSRKTLNEVRDMLEGVVQNGTARNIYTTKYRIAGKTGTARLALGSAGYGGGRYRASFVGYFPADKPLYSCIVVIDNPFQWILCHYGVCSGVPGDCR